ncbi:MFS transporter [Candidatus Bathyarchaeota archaeon]|nr:MAG: MFS transporter [Candidatus Bathyarchaeota archaeon]
METFNRLRVGFDRDIGLLTGSMFTRRIVMGFLQVVRAIYFALLGFSPVEIGLLLSVATLISAVNNILFGYLCDRYGRKPFLVLGCILSSVRTGLFAVTTDFWLLALAQGVGAMGEGVGAGQPVVSGYITDKTDPLDRPNVYSTMAITNSLAATIGLAFGGLPQYLESSMGFDVVGAHQLLWAACTVINLVSLVFLFPLRESHTRMVEGKPRKSMKIRNWSTILKFSLVRSTSGFGWSMIDSMMTLYFFYRFSVGSDVLGPVLALARFISMFTYLLVPRIVDWLGAINTLIVSRGISSVLTVGFALASWYPLALVLMVLTRLAVLFSMPIRQTFASGMVDPDETATAIGISNSARMGAQTIAPSLAGYMFEAVSLTLPFFTGAVLMALNGVLYWHYFRDKN